MASGQQTPFITMVVLGPWQRRVHERRVCYQLTVGTKLDELFEKEVKAPCPYGAHYYVSGSLTHDSCQIVDKWDNGILAVCRTRKTPKDQKR